MTKIPRIRWNEDLSYQFILLVSTQQVHLTKQGEKKNKKWKEIAETFTKQTNLQTTPKKMSQHWTSLKTEFLRDHSIDIDDGEEVTSKKLEAISTENGYESLMRDLIQDSLSEYFANLVIRKEKEKKMSMLKEREDKVLDMTGKQKLMEVTAATASDTTDSDEVDPQPPANSTLNSSSNTTSLAEMENTPLEETEKPKKKNRKERAKSIDPEDKTDKLISSLIPTEEDKQLRRMLLRQQIDQLEIMNRERAMKIKKKEQEHEEAVIQQRAAKIELAERERKEKKRTRKEEKEKEARKRVKEPDEFASPYRVITDPTIH